MADVATLGLEVRSDGVRKSAGDLDKLTNSAKRAEAAAGGLSAASKRAEAALAGESAAANTTAKALAAHNAAANSNNAAVIATGNAAKGSGLQMRMMAMQLSQVAQQTQATGNFMQALAIQLPDMALGFGVVGIALGVLAGILLPLVDGGKAMAVVVNALAGSLEAAAPYAAMLAATLGLIYAPAIIGGMVSLIALIARVGVASLAAGGQMAAAWLIGLGPIGAIIAGVGAIAIAAYALRDQIKQAIGVDVVGVMKTAANFVVGSFVGAFEAIKATWSMLPAALGDLTYSTANAVIKGIESMVNQAIGLINNTINESKMAALKMGMRIDIGFLNPVNISGVENPYAGAASKAGASASDAMKGAMGRDYVGEFGTALGKGAEYASGKLKELSGWLTKVDEKKKKGGGKSDGEKFSDIVDGANRRIAEMKAEEAALGMTGEAAQRLRYEAELLNQAQQKGISLTPAQTAALKALAATMAEVASATKFASLVHDANNRLTELKAEQAAVGLSEEAATRLRYQTELLNEAERDGIELTAERRAKLASLAGEMANVEIATKRAEEALAFAKDVTKGFIGDLKSGLEQGKSFWDSFSDAALNALNKIVDKLLNDVLDAVFQVHSAGSGGGGGFLSSIFSLFGGGGGGANVFPSAPIGLYAKGGIANRPSVFGEAGPEAAVPLPDGRRIPVDLRGLNDNPRQAANQNVHVTVGVSVDNNGNLQAYVKNVAQNEAASASNKAVSAFANNKSAAKNFTRQGLIGLKTMNGGA